MSVVRVSFIHNVCDFIGCISLLGGAFVNTIYTRRFRGRGSGEVDAEGPGQKLAGHLPGHLLGLGQTAVSGAVLSPADTGVTSAPGA